MVQKEKFQVVDDSACKFSGNGWFQSEFADANRPLLEILSKFLENRNVSKLSAWAHHLLLEILPKILKIQMN